MTVSAAALAADHLIDAHAQPTELVDQMSADAAREHHERLHAMTCTEHTHDQGALP